MPSNRGFKLDYIKTRVKKIWLKVKDEGDPE